MTTQLLSFFAALAFSAGVAAQDLAAVNDTKPVEHGGVNCLMKSTASTWQALGLTAEKSRQAQAIADRCIQEHKANPPAGEASGSKDDTSEAHVQELKNLLSADEFAKWKDWCGKQDAPKDKPKSEIKY